jgi:hypothetical protein
MIISVANDTCSDASIRGYLRDGDRLCFSATASYSPGLLFTGTPVAPTCPASATMSGSLTGTGAQTLCCL